MKHEWFCEIDPFCQSVLSRHWPEVPIFGDVQKLEGKALPDVDILCGGFPCQDVSQGGNRAGIKTGTRSGLWLEYARIIREIRPKYAIIENVRGLLSCGIEIVLQDLAAIGYDAEWEVLPAAALGAPHHRERVFIVAYPNRGDGNRRDRLLAPLPAYLGEYDKPFQCLAWAGIRIERTSRKAIREKAVSLLKFVELEDKIDAYPSQLSGGQKQRVAIARALASDPKVLLCDEATSALDPQTTTSILKLLKKLNAETGITIVVITHQMQVVKELCQRVAVMEKGKVVEEGEVYSIFAGPKKPITQSFINTASNLSRVQEFIEENPAFSQLNPGEKIIRLKYLDTSAAEALVSSLSREFGVDLNIIFGNIDWIGNHLLGELIVIASGKTENIPAAIEYLQNKNVEVEVISHDDPA